MKPIALVAIGAIGGALLAGVVVHGMAQAQIAALKSDQRDLAAKIAALETDADKRKGNAATFAAAISNELKKSGKLCLIQQTWPVNLPVNGLDMGQGNQMKALTKVGLVSVQSVQTEVKNFFGKPELQQVNQFNLTPEGEKYTIPAKDAGFFLAEPNGKAICYGQRALNKVLNWEGPSNVMGGPEAAEVLYSYKIENVALWVTDTAVQKAFPNVQLPPSLEGQATVELHSTANGWTARALGN